MPADLDYMQVSALSIEARQKLSKLEPWGSLAHLGHHAGRHFFAADSPEKGRLRVLRPSPTWWSRVPRRLIPLSAHALTHGWGHRS